MDLCWRDTLQAFANRSYELLQKSRNIQALRPEVMNEVDDKALDMAAIMILISYNHQMPLPQRLDILFRVVSLMHAIASYLGEFQTEFGIDAFDSEFLVEDVG